MTTIRIEERFAYAGGKVDRTGPRPIVRDVLLCGPTSANRRRYMREMFAGDKVQKYNGRPVFLNHSTGGAPRQYESRIAKVINARHRADGMPIGDLEVRPKHPFAESFLDDAEHDPSSVGMSHVAHCQTRPGKDGWDDVHTLESVESVDVVLDPATTKGLHEGKTVQKISFKTFVERFGPKWGPTKWGAAVKLCEDIGDMGDMPVMDEPPADAPEGDLKAALMAALTPMLDEAFKSGDATKAMAALKDFIKLHAKHTGQAVPKDAPTDPVIPESKAPAVTLAGVLAECKAAGLAKPTTEDLVALTEIPTTGGRTALINSLKRVAESAPEKPFSTGRNTITPPAPTTQVTESKPPTDAAGFAALIR